MNKVKYYRLISGLLLKDLSEKTGLSVGHLSHIENGNKQPSTDTTQAIMAQNGCISRLRLMVYSTQALAVKHI